MKKCPYCAEEIQNEAIICRYCRNILNIKPAVPWYFKTSILVVAFLSVGPLALPLVWFNPRFSRKTKIIVSVVTVILSYYLGILLATSLKSIGNYYHQIDQLGL